MICSLTFASAQTHLFVNPGIKAGYVFGKDGGFTIMTFGHNTAHLSAAWIMHIVLFFVLCSFGITRAGESQEPRKPEGLVTLGIGTGYIGPTFYAGLNYIVNNNLFTVRYWKADEFRFNMDGRYDEPALRGREFGLLYGRTFRIDIRELSVCAGIAYIDGIDRGKRIGYNRFEPVHLSTIGIPFEVRFRIDMGVVSLGGAWYGDITNKRFYSGAMLELSVEPFGD
jgi:hypothetical protein